MLNCHIRQVVGDDQLLQHNSSHNLGCVFFSISISLFPSTLVSVFPTTPVSVFSSTPISCIPSTLLHSGTGPDILISYKSCIKRVFCTTVPDQPRPIIETLSGIEPQPHLEACLDTICYCSLGLRADWEILRSLITWQNEKLPWHSSFQIIPSRAVRSGWHLVLPR